MREYVHLHRKIVASWVFEDPRRLQLFIYLLAKADERGVVRLSVNGYANAYGYQRMQVVRILQAMEEEGIIVQQTSNKCSTVTLCKYVYYNATSAQSCSTGEQQTSNTPTSQEEKEEARERKVPPHPLIKKEKEEKKRRSSVVVVEHARGVRFRRGDLRGRNRHHTARCRNHGAGLQPAENGGAGHARAPHRGRGEGAPAGIPAGMHGAGNAVAPQSRRHLPTLRQLDKNKTQK